MHNFIKIDEFFYGAISLIS